MQTQKREETELCGRNGVETSEKRPGNRIKDT